VKGWLGKRVGIGIESDLACGGQNRRRCLEYGPSIGRALVLILY